MVGRNIVECVGGDCSYGCPVHGDVAYAVPGARRDGEELTGPGIYRDRPRRGDRAAPTCARRNHIRARL